MYAPFMFLFMRQVARANTGKQVARVTASICVILPMVEVSSLYLKNLYYWPIVKEVYIESK